MRWLYCPPTLHLPLLTPMRFYRSHVVCLFVALFGWTLSSGAMAKGKSLRFFTAFTGAHVCLDILADGQKRTPTMAGCAMLKGQSWQLVETTDVAYVRLKNNASGEGLCLDVATVGSEQLPVMSECGNYSGQFWKLQAIAGSDEFKLKNTYSGESKCLDIINDGNNNRLIMAHCENVTGQFWRNAP